MSLLVCKSLSIGYPGHLLADGISFSIDRGDCLCILGENGSGKSTFVKTLLNLQPPLAGSICFSEGLSPADIGYLPQMTAIPADFPATVSEVVLSGCLAHCGWRPFRNAKDKACAERHIERLGLSDLRRRSFRELSGGQRQRTLLARALCAARHLLLLDEPVAGLDPATQADFYQLLHSLRKDDGMCVIMVSHDLQGSENVASHVLHMSPKPFFGTWNDYLESPSGRRFVSTRGI